MFQLVIFLLLLICLHTVTSFSLGVSNRLISHTQIVTRQRNVIEHGPLRRSTKSTFTMNFFEDAFRFFSNLNKEASAKHILMTGPEASKKLTILKEELKGATDLSTAFSELAMKVFH